MTRFAASVVSADALDQRLNDELDRYNGGRHP